MYIAERGNKEPNILVCCQSTMGVCLFV